MSAVVSGSRARSTWLTGAAGLLMLAAAVVMMVMAAPKVHAVRHESVTGDRLASWVWVTPAGNGEFTLGRLRARTRARRRRRTRAAGYGFPLRPRRTGTPRRPRRSRKPPRNWSPRPAASRPAATAGPEVHLPRRLRYRPRFGPPPPAQAYHLTARSKESLENRISSLELHGEGRGDRYRPSDQARRALSATIALTRHMASTPTRRLPRPLPCGRPTDTCAGPIQNVCKWREDPAAVVQLAERCAPPAPGGSVRC